MINENIGLSFRQKCSVTLKMRQIRFQSELCAKYRWGSYDAPQHPVVDWIMWIRYPSSFATPETESWLHHWLAEMGVNKVLHIQSFKHTLVLSICMPIDFVRHFSPLRFRLPFFRSCIFEVLHIQSPRVNSLLKLSSLVLSSNLWTFWWLCDS